ncbi:MAG TPA: hypothetical protein VGM30_04790 [Puia sp.]|jgi:hypothetical protein
MDKPIRKTYKCISISLTQESYDKALAYCRKTPYQTLSAYGRKLLTQEPITVYYRNKSFDEFTESYILFKNSMEIILVRGNFNDYEKQRLLADIVDIKEIINKIYDHVRENKSLF